MRQVFILFLILNLNLWAQEYDGYIVDFHDDISWQEVRDISSKLDLKIQAIAGFENTEKLGLIPSLKSGLKKIVDYLANHPRIESIEPNYILRLPEMDLVVMEDNEKFPNPNPKDYNDPFYVNQWHMAQIGVAQAHKMNRGQGAIVAVLDTGVAYEDNGRFKRARDLNQTKFISPYNFLNNTTDAFDDHGHGTHVAGTIAQSTNNGLGVIGVAPEAVIMPLKVLGANGGGDIAGIARAIKYAADNGAHVINLSLGGPMPTKVLQKALQYARSRGVLPVCAAGNSGASVGYPAAFPECMAVSAVQYDQTITFYSSRGPQVDIAAPGGNIRVDQNGDGFPDGVLQNTIYPEAVHKDDYMLFMGTSMAAPHVAGVAALLVSAGVRSPDSLEAILKKSSKPKDDPKLYGAGLLDAKKALEMSKKYVPDTRWYIAGAALLLSGTVPIFWSSLGYWMGFFLFGTGLLSILGIVITLESVPAILLQPIGQWDLSLLSLEAGLAPLRSILPVIFLLGLFWHLKQFRGFMCGASVGMLAFLLGEGMISSTGLMWFPLEGWQSFWYFAHALILLCMIKVLFSTKDLEP